MLIEDFGVCEICNSLSWVKVYEGLVCNDAFGHFTESTFVAKCYGYGIERLSEDVAKRSNDFYETKEYRSLLRNRSPATQLALLFLKNYLMISGAVRLRRKMTVIIYMLFSYGQISYEIASY